MQAFFVNLSARAAPRGAGTTRPGSRDSHLKLHCTRCRKYCYLIYELENYAILAMTWFLIGVGHLNQAAMPRIIFCWNQNKTPLSQQLHFPACDTYAYNAARRNQFKSFFSYYLIWIICWLALEADCIWLYNRISELGKSSNITYIYCNTR